MRLDWLRSLLNRPAVSRRVPSPLFVGRIAILACNRLRLLAAATFVAKPLIDAVAKHIAQASLPALVRELKVRRETHHLEYAHDLAESVRSGLAKPGQYVEGTGFFSTYTVSHIPAVPLMWQITAMAGGVIAAATSTLPRLRKPQTISSPGAIS